MECDGLSKKSVKSYGGGKRLNVSGEYRGKVNVEPVLGYSTFDIY